MSAQVSTRSHEPSPASDLSIDEFDALIADRVREYSNEIYLWTHQQWTDWRARASQQSSPSKKSSSTRKTWQNSTSGAWAGGGDIDGDKFHLYYDNNNVHDEPVNPRAKTIASSTTIKGAANGKGTAQPIRVTVSAVPAATRFT